VGERRGPGGGDSILRDGKSGIQIHVR
jgi:hypothetical protein